MNLGNTITLPPVLSLPAFGYFGGLYQRIREILSCFSGQIYTLFASLLLFTSPLYSQSYLFDAKLITPDDGLANLMTTAITKDHKGFLWIGTRYGLNRYDGHHFRLYTKEKNGLSYNDNIRRISEDGAGNLWLFYKNQRAVIPDPEANKAVDIFNPQTDQATPFDVYFAGKAPFVAADIAAPSIVDPKNRHWILTKTGALFLYDGAFKKVLQQEGVFFQYITIDSTDQVWAASGNRLFSFDPSGKLLEESIMPNQIGGIYTGADQSIWLSILEPNTMRIWHRTKEGRLTPFQLSGPGHPLDIKRPNDFFVHRHPKGYWYIGIDGQLNVFDAQGAWLFNYHTLIGENVKTIFFNFFEDTRSLWLTTPTGVLQASITENRFNRIQKLEKGFSDCRGITEDDVGNIYFLNTYLYQWNPNHQRCTKLSDNKGAFGVCYADSLIWAGDYTTKSLGFEFDLRTHHEIRYPVSSPDIHLAYAVVKTSQPGLLLAGQNKGLGYINLTTKQVIPFEQYNGFDLLRSSEVNFIHKNASGFWLATDHGIFLMQETAGIIRHFDTTTGDLPFNYIRHICEDRDGIFWLATKGGGIIQWRPALEGNRRSESKQLTTSEGLFDNFTYAVYEDDYGKLWIPCDKGLMWMDKRSLRVRTFQTQDGLPHNEFNHTAHYQAKDGTLYFGGLGGLVAIHPKDFAADFSNQTPLRFTGFFLLEGDAEAMTDKTNLIQQSDVITIQPSDKFFELHFNLLDYTFHERHRFAYQIEGYSNNWNYIDENFIRITNLPYGKYTLKIRGQQGSEGWSTQELSLGIRVLKPFYWQWWFILAAILFIAGAVWASVQSRVKKLKKDREQLELEVQKRTWQIEQDKQTIAAQAEALQQLDEAKTRFFSNITHEFRTPLTLIIGPVEQLLTHSPLPVRKSLSGVLKNARHLLLLINQLLDLSKLESRQMQQEAVHGDIVAYTKELVNVFKPLADKKEQQLRFVPGLAIWETHFDKNAWDKILYNLLSNAIKFTPKGGVITVAVAQEQAGSKEVVHLQVTDTGIGIKPNDLAQIFNRFYQVDGSYTRAQGGTGIGLALVKELVDLHNGDIQVSSEMGTGTTFDVRLAVLSPHLVSENTSLQGLPDFLAPLSAEAALPAADKALAVVETTTQGMPRNKKLELLIIEDNEEMRSYIRQCLDASKYHVSEAPDGEEGIQKAQSIVPDLIISDVMMPGKNGFEVVQAIRDHIATSHIPLILLTAKTALESRLKGLARGADAYLIKPFSPQELTLHIQNLIALRQLLRTRYQSGPAPDHDPNFQQEDLFMAELTAYIKAHIRETDLNVDAICRQFGISRSHFYRKLDALIGKPIGDYVRTIRLETATQLLKERRLRVAEVAYATGFASPSHFSRTYKKAYGKPPSEGL